MITIDMMHMFNNSNSQLAPSDVAGGTVGLGSSPSTNTNEGWEPPVAEDVVSYGLMENRWLLKWMYSKDNIPNSDAYIVSQRTSSTKILYLAPAVNPPRVNATVSVAVTLNEVKLSSITVAVPLSASIWKILSLKYTESFSTITFENDIVLPSVYVVFESEGSIFVPVSSTTADAN